MNPQRKSLMKTLEHLIIDDPKTPKDLKILMVAAETAPYAYEGGIAMVMGSLSKALASLGHDVRIFMPKFGGIDEEKYELETIFTGLEVPTGDDENPVLICNIKQAKKPDGVPIYFLENQEYYEKRANIYGYSDDSTRWALLSRGCLEFIRTQIFSPDILHCNDWHTGLVPDYIRSHYKKDPLIKDIATVFTIHSMKYQGVLDHHNVPELDIDDGRSVSASFFSERLKKQNFMRRGILHADTINTVSKKYSREVLTPDYGEGLEKLLLELQGKFFGIMNGLDYSLMDPRTDKLILRNYGIGTLDRRLENKKALQKEFDLKVSPDTLVLGTVGRLDYQKGTDLIVNTLHHVLHDYDIQFVQVGGGDMSLVKMLRDLKAAFPNKVGIHPYPNFVLPRLVFAGADVILYPSRFEPCGVVQLEAMRYGAVPLVRSVGGLADSVENFDSSTMIGNGFVFTEFNEFGLFGQIVRAVELYKHKDLWTRIQKNGMKEDYSWESSAVEYVKLYDVAQSFHKNLKS